MSEPSRTPRSDAVRNRELVLSAAEDEFAERGADASIAAIARRAGLAKGTVFRHFPTKEQLISAVVANHIAELSTIAHGLQAVDEPDGGLLEFLAVAADRRRQRDLTYLLSLSESDPVVAGVRTALRDNIEALLTRAQTHGSIRHDVTATDVFLMMCAPVHIAEYLPGAPNDLWRRYLMLMFDGLRVEGATSLTTPAPQWA